MAKKVKHFFVFEMNMGQMVETSDSLWMEAERSISTGGRRRHPHSPGNFQSYLELLLSKKDCNREHVDKSITIQAEIDQENTSFSLARGAGNTLLHRIIGECQSMRMALQNDHRDSSAG